MEKTTEEARRQLIDLASGGDGIVGPTKEHLDPPHVINGHAYSWRVVKPEPFKGHPENRVNCYVDTEEQADKLLHIGDLNV